MNAVIGPVRITFPNLFTAKENGKYDLTMLIPKTEAGEKMVAKIKEMAKAAVIAKWSDEKTRPRKLSQPVKDGDSGEATNDGIPKGEKYPEYANHYYCSASSKYQPGVVDQNVQKVLDASKIYSGVWVNVQVNAYTFDRETKGVSLGLLNVQIVKDDERFGGSAPRPEDAFGKIGDGAGFVSDSDDMFA